jgi:hypothetical protein
VHLGNQVAARSHSQSTSEATPRLSCHVLFLGIACTRAHSDYRLTAS